MAGKKLSRLEYFVYFLAFCLVADGRIHKLKIENDARRQIDLSTFGFVKGGYLSVELINFQVQKTQENDVFGFTLDKTVSTGISPYLESKSEKCILTDSDFIDKDDSVSVIFFKMDLKKLKMKVSRKGKDLAHLTVLEMREDEYNLSFRGKRSDGDFLSDSYLMPRQRRAVTTKAPGVNVTPAPTPAPTLGPNPTPAPSKGILGNLIKINSSDVTFVREQPSHNLVNDSITMTTPDNKHYSVHFLVAIDTEEQEGLYNLFFHNCHNYELNSGYVSVNFSIKITENNNGNYLSAGKMPLPNLYFTLCVVYLLVGCLWIYVLRASREGDTVIKTHYLMCVLVFVKAVALLFHAINFYFIEKEGHHEEAWAILYYITMLMKGALLFITIVLIGAGWAFVKHILSDRDKKIFIIVIPLQILANIAQIIIEETEEGQSQYTMWKEIFILVDLLCCGSILFPVVWSIRHLQEGSMTDGKVAINLAKLKIFRHFYILIVCYIYFTRIIVYLLKITVPFQYEWLDELFKEIATFIFFVVTGYKFRPASNNPYLQLSQEEDDVEMDEVLTRSGAYENVVKVNVKYGNSAGGESSDMSGPSKRESSHEYD